MPTYWITIANPEAQAVAAAETQKLMQKANEIEKRLQEKLREVQRSMYEEIRA